MTTEAQQARDDPDAILASYATHLDQYNTAADIVARHDPRAATVLRLRALVDVRDHATDTARTLGMTGVRDGQFSRVEASRLLGVHQGTIADWLRQNRYIEPPEQLR